MTESNPVNWNARTVCVATATITLLVVGLFFRVSLRDSITPDAIANTPVEWELFTSEALDKSLSEGRITLVFFHGDWNPYSLHVLEEMFDARLVRDTIGANNIETYLADASREPPDNPDVRKGQYALAAMGYQIAIPTIAIFGPGSQDEPIVLRVAFREHELVAALNESLERYRRSRVADNRP